MVKSVKKKINNFSIKALRQIPPLSLHSAKPPSTQFQLNGTLNINQYYIPASLSQRGVVDLLTGGRLSVPPHHASNEHATGAQICQFHLKNGERAEGSGGLRLSDAWLGSLSWCAVVQLGSVISRVNWPHGVGWQSSDRSGGFDNVGTVHVKCCARGTREAVCCRYVSDVAPYRKHFRRVRPQRSLHLMHLDPFVAQ